jgi:hypothetical protein
VEGSGGSAGDIVQPVDTAALSLRSEDPFPAYGECSIETGRIGIATHLGALRRYSGEDGPDQAGEDCAGAYFGEVGYASGA